MPFDGSGNFTRDYNFQEDRDNGIKIMAARVDGEFDNYATGLSQTFLRDGSVPMSGNLLMNSNRITGLADGSAASPSTKFNGDANTGVFLKGVSQFGIAAAAVEAGYFENGKGLNVTQGGRFQGGATPFGAGSGLELGLDTNGFLRAYDRTGAAYLVLDMYGSAINIKPGGTTVGAFSSTGLAVTGTLSSSGAATLNSLGVTNVASLSAGLVGTPSLAFTGDLNTGLWSPGADIVALSTGGTERLRADASGRIGIGKTPAAYTLEVLDTQGSTIVGSITGAGTGAYVQFADSTTSLSGANAPMIGSTGDNLDVRINNALKFRFNDDGDIGLNTSTIDNLGTSIPTFQLKGGSTLRSGGLRFSTSDSSSEGSLVIVDGKLRLLATTNNAMEFFTNNILRMTVSGSGELSCAGVYNSTTASAANVFVAASGLLARSTSSLKYKNVIRDITNEDAYKILGVQGFIYTSRSPNDDPSKFFYGFGAEDFIPVDNMFVTYGADGTAEALQYERMVVSLQQIIKNEVSLRAEMESRIKALEDKIASM